MQKIFIMGKKISLYSQKTHAQGTKLAIIIAKVEFESYLAVLSHHNRIEDTQLNSQKKHMKQYRDPY